MGKKRKHDDSDGEGSDKRVKLEESYVNGLNNTTINSLPETSKYQVFLIKKPSKMSLEDLEKLKWSFDKDVLKKDKFKTDSGNFRAIISTKSKNRKKMVHVPAVKEITSADSKNLKPAGAIEGSITIIPAGLKPKSLGGSIYEEGEEPTEDAEIHPNLMKIKREAILDLASRRERNKAYGTKTDSDGNVRKLLNLVTK